MFLRLKWLELEAIGRFVGKQRIDFTKLGSLVQVDGWNMNTGGSSGAAKTTVFNALDFLFGLNDKPTTVLQSRLTKDTMTVRGGFDLDGKDLIIARGKKLSVDIDGNITTGSAKLAEEKIDEILGMPRDLFRQMLHKRQKEGGFFLKMTPKEIHDFLISCLGLSEQAKKITKVDSRIGALINIISKVKGDLTGVASAIEATKAARESLGSEPKSSVDQESVLRVKQKVDLLQAHFNKIQEEHKVQAAALESQRPQFSPAAGFPGNQADALDKERTDIRQQIQALIEKERARQDEMKKWIAEFKAELYRLHNQIASGSMAKKEAPQVAAEVMKIRKAICPTCDQSWVTDAAKTKEAELLAKLASIKETIELGQQAGERNAHVSSEIERLNGEAQPLHTEEHSRLLARERELNDLIRSLKRAEEDIKEVERSKYNAVCSEFVVKQGQLRSAQNTELEQIRTALDAQRRTFDSSVHELKSYATALAKYEQSREALNQQVNKYAGQVETLAGQLLSAEKELIEAEEAKRAIKSFVSCSFDDALISIGDTATRIIRNIPNMANGTIRLEGTRETKDGKVKEEVNAVIDNDGEEGVPLKSFCGGEESAIDLAVDLAVIDFVENRANKGIDVFILDEPFTGMDTVIIEDALQVLKTANINKRLVIVDHNPEVKQMVESRLLVIRDGVTSRIEQA